MFPSFLIAAAALANVALAQSTTLPATVTLPSSVLTAPSAVTATGDIITSTGTVPPPGATSYPIDPNAIDAGVRAQWCNAEYNSCFQLCNSDPQTNTCDDTTLEWACQCANGPTPNLGNFNQTIPYFECITYVANCVAATDSAEQQRQCQQTQCGGPVLPIDYNGSSATSGTMSATSTDSTMSATVSAAATTPTDGGNSAPAFGASDNLGLSLFAIGAAALALAL